MQFLVRSREEIEQETELGGSPVISIRGLEDRAALIKSVHPRSILYLQFNDCGEAGWISGRGRFTGVHAKAILEFVSALEKNACVVCQCEAGISRSAAVAAALTKIHGEDDAGYFQVYMPNIFVYRRLRASAGCPDEYSLIQRQVERREGIERWRLERDALPKRRHLSAEWMGLTQEGFASKLAALFGRSLAVAPYGDFYRRIARDYQAYTVGE